jgi:hypothetical protein
MRTISSTLLAVALHAAALAGVVHASLATELPALYRVTCGGFLWPTLSLHVGELLLGHTESEVRARFGDTRGFGESGVGRQKTCLLYRFASSDLLVLLLEGSVVTQAWVVQGSDAPAACDGVSEREVAVAARSVWIGS